MGNHKTIYTGNEVDEAVAAARSGIPQQITQINTRVTALEEDVDDLSGLPAQVTQIGLELGEVITQSATGASSNIRAKVDISLSAGATIFYSYVSDSSAFPILIRFHYTDNTTESIYSGSTTLKEGSATCSKATDYIEAVRYANTEVDGHTISLTVSTGIKAAVDDLDSRVTENESDISTLGTEVGDVYETQIAVAGAAYDAEITQDFPAGTHLYFEVVSDNPLLFSIFRVHHTDNTYTQNYLQSGDYTGDMVLEKDVDFVQVINNNNTQSGNVSLKVYSGLRADARTYEDDAKSYADLLASQVMAHLPLFEAGNLNITGTGWSYGMSSTRVTLKAGTTLHLFPGDVIGLTDYNAKVFYVGWRKSDGTYDYNNGWLSNDFTAPIEADYVVLLRNNPESNITKADDLAKYFFVRSLKDIISEIDKRFTATIGQITSVSGTSVNGNYTLTCPVSFSAGTPLLIQASIDTNSFPYWLQWSYADGTYAYFDWQARGGSTIEATPTKDISAVKLFSNASVAGYSASLTITDGLKKVHKTDEISIDNLIKTSGWKIPQEYFEIGNINISTSGWSYSDSANRVRLACGCSIHLKAGDVVGLTSYTNRRFYLGGNINGTYIAIGWNTSDVTITQEGDYVINFTYKTPQVIVNVTELSDIFFIKRAGGLLEYMEGKIDYAAKGLKDQSILYKNVYSVAHRGYTQNLSAPIRPENTMAAFKLARELGYCYVETDVKLTSDGEYVLLHDTTIDRTSNGTGAVASMTLEQLRTYDFGYLNGNPIAGYSTEKIPTLREFLVFCHRVGLYPLIEIELALTQTQVDEVVEIINDCGMRGKCAVISLQGTAILEKFHTSDELLDLGVLESALSPAEITDALVAYAVSLKGDSNNVFISAHTYTTTEVGRCRDANIPLGIYTINNATTALSLPDYVTFITTDSLNFGKLLYDAAMGD